MHEGMEGTSELSKREADLMWVREIWLNAARARADMLTARGTPTDWRDVLHEIALTKDEVLKLIAEREAKQLDNTDDFVG